MAVRKPARGSGGGWLTGVGVGERQWWPAGGRRKKMTSGTMGKMVFYAFAQLKIIIILDVVCWR